MNETIQTIIEWHQECFHLANSKTQFVRLIQEINEYEQAETVEHKLEELADCFITICGSFRFSTLPPIYQLHHLYSQINEKYISTTDLMIAIDEKMVINRQRQKDNYWVYDEETQQYVARHKLNKGDK